MGGRFAEVLTSTRGPKLDDVADAPTRLREGERLTGEEALRQRLHELPAD